MKNGQLISILTLWVLGCSWAYYLGYTNRDSEQALLNRLDGYTVRIEHGEIYVVTMPVRGTKD